MVQCVNIFHKYLERSDEYSKHRTADFEYTANITANSASVITKEKKIGNENNKKEENQVISYDEGEFVN